MLFNSYIFLFGFLPISLFVTYALGRWRQRAAKVALTVLSLGFYAWWRPIHLPLLLFSIVFNYFVGGFIQDARAAGRSGAVKAWLLLGVIVDLAMLGWFKYAFFVSENLHLATGIDLHVERVALPLAISFFTFQKLAYLIDSARGDATRISFLDFALFAAFYPQLIAGPIVHYQEIVPQIRSRLFARRFSRNFLVGLVIFAIGLFKKTVIADTLSSYANPLYAGAAAGQEFNIAAGWAAAITYTAQLYFDFSGYSDMAIGLGRMLGVKLPLNFHSPLRASGVIEYWRRWHMTLQRFIVAYIFQPLSLPMNRIAAQRGLKGWPAFIVASAIPTFVTFLAVGVWHGAGWTFVVFGLLHAIYVSVNDIWRERTRQRKRKLKRAGKVYRVPGPLAVIGFHAVTLMAVIYANVMFRAESVANGLTLWAGMSGLGVAGLGAHAFALPANAGWGLGLTLAISIALIFLAPNTQQIMRRYDPAYNAREWIDVAPAPLTWTWRADWRGLTYAGLVLFFGIVFIERGQAVFLYFNF